MAVNWGMGGPQNNALSFFQFGQQLGSQVRERRDAAEAKKKEEAGRKSLADYAVNPNDAGFAAAVQYDPRGAMGIRQGVQQQQAQQQEQRRADLPLIGRLLDHSRDETTYQQARQAAQQYGIDVSQLPPTFDPQWVETQRMTIKALSDPTKMEALSNYGKIAADEGLAPGSQPFNARVTQLYQADQVKTIPYTQGGGVAGYNAVTGQTSTIVAPNPGGFAPGAPVGGGGVSEGATATNPQTGEKIQFKGGQWVPVGQGGGGARVTGNFLDGL